MLKPMSTKKLTKQLFYQLEWIPLNIMPIFAKTGIILLTDINTMSEQLCNTPLTPLTTAIASMSEECEDLGLPITPIFLSPFML